VERLKRISIVIPTYKDKVNKINITNLFSKLGYVTQVIISRDDPHIGKGNAILKGLKLIKEDYIVIMDADLQIDPSDIDTFFNIMELYSADVVVGNKYHLYSNIEYPIIRKVISFGYRILVKVLFNLPLRDTQCGFKLFKRNVINKITPVLKETRYCLDLEMLIALRKKCIRVADAPVYVKKQNNIGSVNLSNILITFIDTIRVWVKMLRGKYN
jgi:glycosyltransferase involved in cell wall biosynthesis